VRTILDGEPAEIEIHLRNERMPLAIYQDGERVVAAWKGPDRLIPTDLRRDEVERRRNLMLELLAETRARLGLARFRPSETLRVRLHRTLATVETMVTYRNGEATGFIGRGRQLDPREAARIANLARSYLEAARQHFGTAAITGPLPALSDIR